MLTDISNTKSMKELERHRRRNLSARDAFQLPRTLRTLVWQDALEFELKGELGNVTRLYLQVSKELKKIANKVPPIYRPLIESSADFWKSEADKASKRVYSNNELTVNLEKISSIGQKMVSGSRRKLGERRYSQTTQSRRGPRLVLSHSQSANQKAFEECTKRP